MVFNSEPMNWEYRALNSMSLLFKKRAHLLRNTKQKMKQEITQEE